MKRESFQGILLGIVIMCAVFAFITIAWAAFSSTLTIGGTATIANQSWKVEFTDQIDSTFDTRKNVNNVVPLTGVAASNTNADISEANYAITGPLATGGGSTYINLGKLNQEGDKITYTWYIQNFGTFDSAVTLSSGLITASGTNQNNVVITCAQKGGSGSPSLNSSDITNFCDSHIKAELSWGASGSTMNKVTSGAIYNLSKATPSDNNDVVQLQLTIEFVDDGDSTTNFTNNLGDDLIATISGISLAATQGTTAPAGS